MIIIRIIIITYIYIYIDYIIYIPFATGKVYVLYHISLEVLGGSWSLDMFGSKDMRNILMPPLYNGQWTVSENMFCLIKVFIKPSGSIYSCQLGGGFNPSEKSDRQIGSFPQVGVKIKNIWVATTLPTIVEVRSSGKPGMKYIIILSPWFSNKNRPITRPGPSLDPPPAPPGGNNLWYR